MNNLATCPLQQCYRQSVKIILSFPCSSSQIKISCSRLNFLSNSFCFVNHLKSERHLKSRPVPFQFRRCLVFEPQLYSRTFPLNAKIFIFQLHAFGGPIPNAHPNQGPDCSFYSRIQIYRQSGKPTLSYSILDHNQKQLDNLNYFILKCS